MRAEKHLAICTEECKYNGVDDICSFGLRNIAGCYLDDDVKKYANELYLKTRNKVLVDNRMVDDEDC